MPAMHFAKAEACGNDFLLIDLEACAGRELGPLARLLCDRHTGVGADGIEFFSWQSGRLRLELFNAAGRAAEIYGNGTRCAAAWMARQHGFRDGAIQTGGGERWTKILGERNDAWEIESHMGVPDWSPEAVPLEGAAALGGGRWRLRLEGRGNLDCHALSMGNPQACVQVEAFSRDWTEAAAAIQRSGHFPAGVNVEFWRRLNEQAIEIRIFERGVGEPLSSGTGSTAAAISPLTAGAGR